MIPASIKAKNMVAKKQKVKLFTRQGFWLLIALFLVITLFQYAGTLEHLTASAGLTRYTLERILYLLPIFLAGILFGWRAGSVTALLAVACMLPRAILFSPKIEDAAVETVAIFLIGNLAAYSFEALQKERKRRDELESAHHELELQLKVIEENERRLAGLNRTSEIISQSLELDDVLNSAIISLQELMGVDAARIYILEEATQELILAVAHGVSEAFAKGVGRVKVGEGFNGRVAQTGQHMFVEDASEDPRLTKEILRTENIHSQLIAPLISKGKVMGTLCVAMHSYRRFQPEEVELLAAIGNQIGVAVENARLYEQEREVAKQLRTSEHRYRRLFESAHDAIWLQDVEGNIVAANTACVQLTGYSLTELEALKAFQLLSPDTLEIARRTQQQILNREIPGFLGELKLIKKDGTEAVIQLASSLVLGNGQPSVFQNIARDVTEEKRLQENMRFFLQHITRAQEEERRRIAQELHDDTVQALVVHSRQIDELASSITRISERDLVRQLEDLEEDANAIIQGIRRLSKDLLPATLDRLGLLPALEWLAEDVGSYSGITTEVKVTGPERRFSNEVELVLFRIAQEALRNVWKHAKATKAEIGVRFEEDKVTICVSDNGEGFILPDSVTELPRYGKLGLAGMLERARLVGGNLTVTSGPGKGTIVTADLPV